MGNKRKASLIIIVVILAALTVFSCVPFFFLDNNNVSAATSYTGQTKISLVGSEIQCNTVNKITFDDGVYAVLFAGQNGEGSYKDGGQYGAGATCLAFYDGSGGDSISWTIGAEGGDGDGDVYSYRYRGQDGGGKTGVYSNFALPMGQSADYAYAGGGGGTRVKHHKSNLGNILDDPPSDSFTNAYFKGLSADLGTSNNVKFVGRPGSPTANGKTGYYYKNRSWIDPDPWAQGDSINGLVRVKSGLFDKYVSSSGGGAGYTNGGGGGYGDDEPLWSYPGGGGTSSPNCYPIYAKDTILGVKSSGNGYINLYRLDPVESSFPKANNSNSSADATIIPGESGPYTMDDLDIDLGTYIQTAWIYSTDQITWTMDSSTIKNTTEGSNLTVYCRYVIYTTSSTYQTSSAFSTYYPGYQMKYTSATAVGTDENYTIAKTTITLTKKGYCTFATDPVGKTDLEYTGAAQSLIAKGGTGNYGKMVYSLDQTNWYDDINHKELKRTDVNTYTVYYKIQSTDSLYLDSTTMKQLEVKIKRVQLKLNDPPGVTKNAVVYTGEAQQLFAGAVEWKDSNNEFSQNATTWYQVTTSNTAPNTDNTGGDTNIANITGTDAGISDDSKDLITYYLWARTDGGANHDPVGWTFVTTNQIKKADPNLNSGTLAAIPDLVYNDTNQTLFSGSISRMGNGVPSFGISISAAEKPTSSWTSGGDENGKRMYAADKDGTPYTYYLWAKITEVQNYKGSDWILLKKDGDAITNTIAKATLDVTGTLLPARDYTGESSPILSNIKTTSNTSIKNNFTLKFTEYCSWIDDAKTDEITEELAGEIVVDEDKKIDQTKLFYETRAGTYTVNVEWYPNVNLVPVKRAQYVDGERILGSTTIKQIDVEREKLEFTGLTLMNKPVITKDGYCLPYTDSKFSLIYKKGAENYATDNGISVNNDKDNKKNEVNLISYCFIHLTGESVDPAESDDWVTSTSAADFNDKLMAHKLFEMGRWLLYVRVDRHFNLNPDQIYFVDEFDIDGYVFDYADLTGVDINESITFDGRAHSVATGVLEPKKDDVNVELGHVQYAVGTTIVAPSDGWVDNIADLAPVINAGDYNLFVKWEASKNAVSNFVGYIFATFTIEQCSIEDIGAKNLTFKGANFTGTWGDPVKDSTSATYTKTYENTEYGLGTIGEPDSKIINPNFASIQHGDFGDLYFAVGNSNKPTTDYVLQNDFTDLKIKNVNDYYIWVQWEGSNNVEPGECVYRVYDEGRALVPQFRILQKTKDDNDNVKLADEEFVAGLGPVEYQWRWDNAKLSAYAHEQSLFGSTGFKIQTTINGENYDETGMSYQFLVTSENVKDVTIDTEGWQDSIEACKVSAVGTYSLWVLIRIENTNVNLVKVVKLEKTAEIIQTNSFVRVKPTASNGLKANNGQDLYLITGREQVNPPVEYAVVPENGILTDDKWVSGVKNVIATSAGTYKVYYRGGESESFKRPDDEPVGGYPYIYVYVDNEDSSYNPRPAVSNKTYTGLYLKPFEPGSAYVGTDNPVQVDLLYSWDGESWYTYDKLEGKIDAGYYMLYYKVEGHDDTRSTLRVQIEKADIEVESQIQPIHLVYQGADYQLLNTDIDYVMIDGEDNPLTVDGNILKYSYRDENASLCRTMGDISYGVSTSATDVPTKWETNYLDITARTVGKYYIWVKVDAGDNHNGIEPFCWNEGSPIEIVQLNYQNDDSSTNFNIDSSSTYVLIPGVTYNGANQSLISDVTLKFNVVRSDNSGGFNPVTDLAEIGTVYYALSKNNDATDNDEEDWQRNHLVLTQADAGTYYLKIKLEGDSNLGAAIFCLYLPENPITIEKADSSSFTVSGINPLSQMYTGDRQILADGELAVKITSTNYNLAGQYDATYCYTKTGEVDEVGNEYSTWTPFAETTATEVGEYNLYVRLIFTSDNFKDKVVYLPLFKKTNLAQITKVLAQYIQITTPKFYKNLAYNGGNQKLIEAGSTVKMTSGAEITGQKGTPTYYISESSDENTRSNSFGSFDKVVGKNAGTYHIWVSYSHGAVHDQVDECYVGSVTIYKASEQNIDLVGLSFETDSYDGEEHNIVSEGNLLQILTNGTDTYYTLQKEIDYEEIKYAYSTSPDIMPDPDNNSIWKPSHQDLKALNAGKYYLWVKVTGAGNIASYVKCYGVDDGEYFAIYKVSLFDNNSRDELYNITYHEGLVYTAQSQVLASIDGKLEIKIDIDGVGKDLISLNKDLKIYWGLGKGEDKDDAPTSGWVANVEELQGVNSGDYYLWIWIQEADNIYEKKVHLRTITIGQGKIEFDEPIVHTNLVYNGTYQELIVSAPVPKFVAEGVSYGNEKVYYDAHEVDIKYTLNPTADIWYEDIRDIAGLNAGEYEMTYCVIGKSNWAYAEGRVNIKITPADGSIVGVGLAEAPAAIPNIYYNEETQDLITFGELTDAAIENGCKIVFFYAGDSQRYEYYFDEEKQKYVWGENGPLPGRSEVTTEGNYNIKYFVTGDGNFSNQSEIKDLYITINKRFVYWLVNPEAVYEFDYTQGLQPLINPGQLNVNESPTIYVEYSTEAPGTPGRVWSIEVPTAQTPNLRFVWYRVVTDDNSIFIGQENNVEGTQIAVYIEHNILTIEVAPTVKTGGLQYTGKEQSLIDYYFLSTDYTNAYGEDAPYIEFKLKDDNIWTKDIKATEVGTYTVQYRLVYDNSIFKFMGENDGHETPMEIEVEIKPVVFQENSIRAVFDDETRTMSYEIADEQILNEETHEWETVPMYSADLMQEIEDENGIVYYYHKNDEYSQNNVWAVWQDDAVMTIGTYEFKVVINTPENKKVNFTSYSQNNDFSTYTYTEGRSVQITMLDYSNPAYVRVWIDFTGSMTYEEAEENGYAQDGWIDEIAGSKLINFPEIDSAGNNTVIRIQTVNTHYYYMTNETLSPDNKKQMTLSSQDIKISSKAFNQGLVNIYTQIYLYEVYNIKYDANGGNGEIAEGWKWHNIDYLLAENTFTKDGVSTGGWNTSETGGGDDYSGSMYYAKNASQTFYAKYFKKGENSFVIQWVIKNNKKTYKLERDTLKWFNAALPENETRTVGILVGEGELITLPQIQNAEDGSLSTIFGGYISAWVSEDGNTPYQVGMKATKSITFVASLSHDNYVQCKFENGEGEEIHDSGLIADGAEAYMALSGMDANFINSYKDGYNQWVQDHGTKKLDSSKTPDGIFTYQFGTKSIQPDENPDINNDQAATTSWTDYTTMLIVIGIGVAVAIITLAGYVVYRNSLKSKTQKK